MQIDIHRVGGVARSCRELKGAAGAARTALGPGIAFPEPPTGTCRPTDRAGSPASLPGAWVRPNAPAVDTGPRGDGATDPSVEGEPPGSDAKENAARAVRGQAPTPGYLPP